MAKRLAYIAILDGRVVETIPRYVFAPETIESDAKITAAITGPEDRRPDNRIPPSIPIIVPHTLVGIRMRNNNGDDSLTLVREGDHNLWDCAVLYNGPTRVVSDSDFINLAKNLRHYNQGSALTAVAETFLTYAPHLHFIPPHLTGMFEKGHHLRPLSEGIAGLFWKHDLAPFEVLLKTPERHLEEKEIKKVIGDNRFALLTKNWHGFYSEDDAVLLKFKTPDIRLVKIK